MMADSTRVLAPRYAVAELSDGLRLLDARNADEPCAVASTQKLLTALVVSKFKAWDEEVTVHADDYLKLPLERLPVHVGLRPGERLSVRSLMHLMLLVSANDAAMALARHFGGSITGFVELMNQEAQALGMTKSEFGNPHGLPDEPQYSCATDLLKLGYGVIQDESVSKICGTKSWNWEREGQRHEMMVNSNRLLHEVVGCVGLKTGFSRAAGYCLLTSFNLQNRQSLCVVLGADSQSVWKDTRELLCSTGVHAVS